MPVPKTSTDLNNLFDTPENEVRLAGKLGNMEPITKAHIVDHAPDGLFGRSVLGTDFPHVLGAAFGGEIISHTAKSSGRSVISFSRFPSTIIRTKLLESSMPNFSTVLISSGRAK